MKKQDQRTDLLQGCDLEHIGKQLETTYHANETHTVKNDRQNQPTTSQKTAQDERE